MRHQTNLARALEWFFSGDQLVVRCAEAEDLGPEIVGARL
jgi:hypothetical protein